MGTSRFWRKKEMKDERDAAIGRALSRTMKDSTTSATCPSPEDISVFLDGRSDQKQRDMLMGHLSHCDRCYEVFSMAHKMREEEEEETPPTVGYKSATGVGRRWIYAPIAVAAAAVLIILYKFVIPTFEPYFPPSSSQIAATMAKKTGEKPLFDLIRREHPAYYSFDSAVSLEKVSFRTGVCLMELEISLAAEEKEKSMDLIKGLTSTLRPLEGSDEIVLFYTGISRNIEEGVPPKQFLGRSRTIDSFFKEKGLLLFLRFGEWTGAGRIAAQAQIREFFDVKAVNYFIRNLQEIGLPQGVLKTLEEVKAVLIRNEFTDKDFKHLEGAFTDIIEMM